MWLRHYHPNMFAESPGLYRTLSQWWRENAAREGRLSTLQRFRSAMWDFARESTPARRRQRYGDVDYDWDNHVDTTSATVSCRDRLLGVFNSPYQPTELRLFHQMLGNLPIDFREFTFIDLGSGKGRVLLMAADYPFRRIVGIELLPQLHRVAEENIRKYKSEAQKCFEVESFCCDAREFAFPQEPILLYLFNPLPQSGLAPVIANLEHSLQRNARPVYVIYHNPLLESVLNRSARLRKVLRTDSYSVYVSNTACGRTEVADILPQP